MSTSISPAPPKAAREISAIEWLVAFFGLAALVVGINILIAWRMDVFGILRDAHGRSLITSDHERKEKYLLNQAYVPENFNALLIGASASVNWHIDTVANFRFYNESLEGGDATEERKLVEQALTRGHFEAAVIVLYPRLTDFHLLQDGFDQMKRSEALGSLSLLGVEYDLLLSRLTHAPPGAFPDGSHAVPVHAPPNPNRHYIPWASGFGYDAEAREDYRALAQELTEKGVKLLYVTYPIYEPAYEPNRAAYDHYLAAMLQSMPAGPLIDFDGREYFSFRNDADNYVDEVHLSASGADKFSQILRTQIEKSFGSE